MVCVEDRERDAGEEVGQYEHRVEAEEDGDEEARHGK